MLLAIGLQKACRVLFRMLSKLSSYLIALPAASALAADAAATAL